MLSLRRVGWDLISPHQLRTDQGDVISLFTMCPWDVKVRLREGINRAQVAQILSAIPEATGHENVWGRALRRGVVSISNAGRRGTVRALLAGKLWPPGRKFQHGYAT